MRSEYINNESMCDVAKRGRKRREQGLVLALSQSAAGSLAGHDSSAEQLGAMLAGLFASSVTGGLEKSLSNYR